MNVDERVDLPSRMAERGHLPTCRENTKETHRNCSLLSAHKTLDLNFNSVMSLEIRR
jgi:hypothetical protein